MKKILTLFTALILFGSMMVVLAADYYVAGIGSWDPKAVKMSQVGESEMYTATFANLAANQQQFKVTKDGTWTVSYGWSNAKQNLSNLSLYENEGNVSFKPLSATNNITIYFNSANNNVYVIDESVPYVTITAGTTIYYDLTEYTGSGINIYAPGAPTDWYSSTAAPISFDLSEDWVISSDITLFRSGPNNNWDNRKCATLPTAGQNQIVSTDGINCSWATYVGPVIRPTIKMHGDFLDGWATTAAFTLDEGDATASIELTIPVKGSKSFGMRIGSDDNWTSNGASITRTNKSAVIEAGTGNCSLNADIPGKYTFTWTFSSNTLTVTYPDLPEQFVAFKDLSTQILKDTKVTFEATSTGITNPVYTYFVKPAGGDYGSAVASYTFDTNGEYVVKVSAEGDNTAAPIVAEENVSVYSTHTFTSGTRIYVDFSAMTEGTKGVNYPKANEVGVDYDAAGAGTLKTITFSADVTWTTMADAFIKTEKAGWAALKFSVPGDGQNCAVVAADGASYTWTTLVPPPPTIKLHGDFTGSWANTDAFVIAGNEETASLALTIPAKGMKSFGVRIGSDDNWTSNGAAITRANAAAVITFGEGNCSLNADIPGEYIFTWTYASNTLSVTYPELPSQFVEFDGLASQILRGTEVAFAATSSGITNPVYSYFVKPEGGEYGSAVAAYTFNAEGNFVVKVSAEGDNTAAPVVAEENVSVYDAHTFTSGTILYVDFGAMIDGVKGVNYPYGDNKTSLDYDAAGAGTLKTIVFTADVEWTTNDVFIKTEKNGWAAQKFTVPGAGQNKVVVAADGASYTWETFAPSTYYFKNKWDNDEWTWKEATADGTGKFRLENVIFGGNGVNYNFIANDADAVWKEYTKIKYMDGAQEKVVSVYDTINLVLDPANDTIWAEMVKKGKVVFTIASNSLALCDLGWEPTHPYKYTDMKKQADGTYKWDNGGNEATLPAGLVELKVIKNRDYANGSWPIGSNFEYPIQRSGEYEIAVHFNPYTETIWVDTVCTEPLNIQALSIKGSWDSWAAATPFILGGDNDKSLVTLPLTVGTYTFKLLDGQDHWYGGGETFTRDDISHCGIVAKDESAATDMTIQVDKDGEYLFTYFFETEQLLAQYPGEVPAAKIAPLSGKFTINAKGDTAIFARGNLQYNYEANQWYTAEKQYEALGDLNLRFGDATYQGSIDLFGWSCESSDYGKQWKYKDTEFSGDFVDWGELFAGDAKEWSTLSEAEWNFIMNRKKGGKSLWTMVALSSDSLNGLALFPDDWEAPACASEMVYGFYNVDDKPNYKKNTFTFAEWAELEVAGAVFLPLAGARAGFWGNNWTGSAETSLSNPLSSGYDWVDNVNWMGYYWLSTSKNTTQASTAILPGWHDYKWNVPTIWSREKRRGQPVRLVTRIPKAEHTVVRENLNPGHYYTICYPKAMTDVQGATLWNFIGKDTHFAYIQQETASTIEAGKPYIMYATASTVQAILGDETNAPGANGAIHGTFSDLVQEQLDNFATVAGNDLYLVIGDELRRATGTGTGSNTLPAQRAFVVVGEIPAAPAQMPAHVRSMPLHKDATQGFENLEGGEKPIKVLIDGQLYILRGENVYNANGQIVQ